MKLKDFNKLSISEQERWIEQKTEKVVERLPSLKQELSAYDDKSKELYNLEPSSIKLFSKSYIADIKSKDTSEQGLANYLEQLERYADTPMKQLISETTEERIDSFIDNLSMKASEEEVNYVQNLLDMMSESDRIAFTKSKYFFDTDNSNSEGTRQFYDENHFTINTMKLESFMIDKGYDLTEVDGYEDLEHYKGK